MYCQTNDTLKELLWESVSPCFEALTSELDPHEVEKLNLFELEENVYDVNNGYIKLSLSYPTCGCNCSNIAGAYKQQNKDYTILINEAWSCSSERKLHSNRPIDSVLPEGFGINTFIPSLTTEKLPLDQAIFFLNLQIPRKGTETKVTLEVIPFGINFSSNSPLTYEYSESDKSKNLNDIHYLASKVKDKKTLDYLAESTHDSIDHNDLELINSLIDPNHTSKAFQSLDKLSAQLRQLKFIFYLYHAIEYRSLILDWDQEAQRFYIKTQIPNKETMDFRSFLLRNDYWQGPSC
ncbi:hypothetical protein [Mangrovimonas sp. DI 80]|uniref:hypothetical protein n=1 Tax=Mangrovimonas sp. DI 80 TaxID=1779330 RepID=UPI000975CAD9|nr:hypothetical protein [Mangrovimonas sp. DI 80]OMP31681.1 hypothetical protein BKM32_01020 [Mangrovimonas sp. DI 80]